MLREAVRLLLSDSESHQVLSRIEAPGEWSSLACGSHCTATCITCPESPHPRTRSYLPPPSSVGASSMIRLVLPVVLQLAGAAVLGQLRGGSAVQLVLSELATPLRQVPT